MWWDGEQNQHVSCPDLWARGKRSTTQGSTVPTTRSPRSSIPDPDTLMLWLALPCAEGSLGPGAGEVVQWCSTCLAHVMPWVQFLAPQKEINKEWSLLHISVASQIPLIQKSAVANCQTATTNTMHMASEQCPSSSQCGLLLRLGI